MLKLSDQLEQLRHASDRELANFARKNFLSYRLPASAAYDPLIGFKVMYRAMKRKADPIATQVLNATREDLVITGSAASAKLRVDYLNSLGVEVHSVVIKDGLASQWRTIPVGSLISILIRGLLRSTSLLFQSALRKNRALFFLDELERHVLFKWIEKHQLKRIHDFSQFEVDSNLAYLEVKSRWPSVEYWKYPSPGPLSLHNAILLSDVLCINSPYHLEECEAWDGLIRCASLKMVPPEQYLSYQDQVGAYRDENPMTIGYYSHGSWLRILRGDADDGLNIAASESQLLALLTDFLDQNQQAELCLFLHPMERNLAYTNQLKQQYQRLIEFGDRVRFSDPDLGSSTQQFNQVDVGIGVYSTILFERLFCGGKTLIYSPSEAFPIEGSALNGIAVHEGNKMKLSGMLESALITPTNDYLKEKGLTGYCFKEIQTILPHD